MSDEILAFFHNRKNDPYFVEKELYQFL